MSNGSKKFKRFLLQISILLGITLLVGGSMLWSQIDTVLGRNHGAEVEEPRTPEEQARIDELPPSEYALRRNPTEYQIELFELLALAHDQFYETESDSDLKDYAAAMVRNFVADFFTLSNKNSRTDVGGIQFFSEDLEDNFRNYAIDTFYLYLNQHMEMFGSESLPTVVSTTILRVEFDYRMIEIEEENGEVSEGYSPFGYEALPLEEEVRTIVIEVEWSYANSTLADIEEFQTSARFVLMEVEGEGLRIFLISPIEEPCEYDMWGQCIVNPDASI